MERIHFAPYCAIKYIGLEDIIFHTSMARIKPMLKKNDIVIVDKVTAFNLVHKGFGNFVEVKELYLGENNIENLQEVKKIPKKAKENSKDK